MITAAPVLAELNTGRVRRNLLQHGRQDLLHQLPLQKKLHQLPLQEKLHQLGKPSKKKTTQSSVFSKPGGRVGTP